MTTESELYDALEKYCDELGINACILTREKGAVETVLTVETLELLQAFVEGSGARLLVLERSELEFSEVVICEIPDYTIDALREFFPELEIKRKGE